MLPNLHGQFVGQIRHLRPQQCDPRLQWCLNVNLSHNPARNVTLPDVRNAQEVGMKDESLAMGPAFSRWQHLTDQYASEVHALQRGDASAATRLARLAREMHGSWPLEASNAQPAGAAGKRRHEA